MARFEDRISAARELFSKLEKYRNTDAVIVGLPRGGMITASFLAKNLNLPLDFIIVKKVGAPGNSELAIGAVTEDNKEYSDERFVDAQKAARERDNLYRKNYPQVPLQDKAAILVDDGAATGTTMLTAIAAAKKRGAGKVVVAVPVASDQADDKIRKSADEFICLMTDPYMSAVGEYYGTFPQVEDNEVLEILRTAKT